MSCHHGGAEEVMGLVWLLSILPLLPFWLRMHDRLRRRVEEGG